MFLRPRIEKLTVVALGALLSLSLCTAARAQNPNVVNDPTFNGQTPDFQTVGSISPDWNYTPNFLNFYGTPWTLVSQTLDTPGNLYIYDIDVQFAQAASFDFFVFWDGVPVADIFSSAGWSDQHFLVTAVGPTSDIGFAGSQSAWANLGSVDVSWSGLIDPPPQGAPDSPLDLALVAGVFGGLCGVAAIQSRRQPSLQRCAK